MSLTLLGCGGGGAAAAAWVPENSPATVDYYLYSPLYCFTDAAGTVPCGDTDAIRRHKSVLGILPDQIQATSSKRLTLFDMGGGKWAGGLDGVDDTAEIAAVVETDVFGTTDTFTVWAAFQGAAGQNNCLFNHNTGNRVGTFAPFSDGNIYWDAGNDSTARISGAAPGGYAGAMQAGVFRRVGTASSVRRNGSVVVSGTVSGGTQGAGSGSLWIGSINGSSLFHTGYIAGIGFANADYGADLPSLETYIAGLY